ncbi:MAG: response regulator transcription factor [Solobacterium sp.]|nr:response regulator transcription factor [Solobacterium sp.]
MEQLKILAVEDDRSVLSLIATTLKMKNYLCLTAASGNEGIMMTASYNPDLILLDLGLPDMDGSEVIAKIRSWSNVPIIVISARSEDSDKIEALDAGADDYLTKPFSVEELLARIRATQRRLQYFSSERINASVFENGSLRIDYAAGEVTSGQETVHLTPIEYKLLCLLAQNVGKVLTRSYIINKVWGAGAEETVISSLRVYMASLRKKIEKNDENLIQTHVGIGYRMLKV